MCSTDCKLKTRVSTVDEDSCCEQANIWGKSAAYNIDAKELFRRLKNGGL